MFFIQMMSDFTLAKPSSYLPSLHIHANTLSIDSKNKQYLKIIKSSETRKKSVYLSSHPIIHKQNQMS